MDLYRVLLHRNQECQLASIDQYFTPTALGLPVTANEWRHTVPTILIDTPKDTISATDQELGLDIGHDHFTGVVGDSSNILDCAVDADSHNLNDIQGLFVDNFEGYSTNDYRQNFEDKGEDVLDPGFIVVGDERVSIDPANIDPILSTEGGVDWHDMDMLLDDFELNWENSG